MSFTKTISTVAALASVFAAGTAGWKLADMNSEQPPSALDQRIEQLENQLVEARQQPVESAPPAPLKLPPQPPSTTLQAPTPPPLPAAPPTPPPPPVQNEVP